MEPKSWARFAKAIKFYESMGFLYKDVQWCVPEEFSNMTKPPEANNIYFNDAVFVGSAEQSFLYEYDKLDNRLYYAITPCIRDEQEYNEHTRPYFIKLELFSKDVNQFANIISCAKSFFNREVPYKTYVDEITYNPYNKDLNYKNIEIGSYSIRTNLRKSWVCGTGLAEPRFTYALKR